MRRLLRRLIPPSTLRWLDAFGFKPLLFRTALHSLPQFRRDFRVLKKQGAGRWPLRADYPCLIDRYVSAGSASGHYFHQDFYVARRIFEANPIKHADVGSRIDGFITHVASYRPIEVFDIRPLEINLENIFFKQADLTDIDSVPLEYCDSLSCLHVIEHIGLGRYGDTVDFDGWKKAINVLAKMLKRSGTLYLSTPIGAQRIEFNSQRVFAIQTILSATTEAGLQLKKFSYVDDKGDFPGACALTPEQIKTNLGLEYGCGIFELTKP